MNDIRLTADIEFENEYEQAKHLLIQTKIAIDKLDNQQQLALIQEIIGTKAVADFLRIVQQYRR